MALSNNMEKTLETIQSPKLRDEVRYWIEVEVKKAVRAEREACAQLALHGQTDAKTQKRLREDLFTMIQERGIG